MVPSFDLSPAEALVLLDPAFNDGRKALKLSLRWLIAHGFFNATREKKPGTWVLRTRPRLQPAVTSWSEFRLPADAAALVELARSAPTDFFEDLLPIVRWTYGNSCSRFLSEAIKPTLVARGLLTCQPVRNIIGIQQISYARTPAGDDLYGRLSSLFAAAERIPRIAATDPDQVAELAFPLGGLLLVLTELRPEWTEIADALRSSESDTGRTYPRFDLSRLDKQALDAIDALIDED